MQLTEKSAPDAVGASTDRSTAPVFVLGCGRSGTTLLYHMILSAGDFAVYRTESNVINLLEPRFGKLSVRRNREKLMDAWINSKLFWVSGLNADEIRNKVLQECRNGGDFLRIIMGEMARQQGVRRWADCTPEHLLYMPRIKETIPDALIIHIIRDGRDVALSTDKLGYIKRAPWDNMPSVMVAGLYWEWMVRRGREDGRKLGNAYLEVRFEDLVTEPRETLAKLSSFIHHDLDYDRIQRVGIGSVSDPNTSFRNNTKKEEFSPIGRWKRGYSAEHLAIFEKLVGKTLQAVGYELATAKTVSLERPDLRRMRAIYRAYFDTKLYFKAKTPLGQLFATRDLSWI